MVVVYHSGTVLSLTGVFMKDMLYLRLLTLVGSSCSMAYYGTRQPILWGPIVWGIIFGIANLNMILRLVLERVKGVDISPEDLRLYRRHFSNSGVTLRQFLCLRKSARLVEVAAGQFLRQRRGPRSNLMLLLEGEVAVCWGRHMQVKRLLDGGHAGSWLGEMGFLMRWSRAGQQPTLSQDIAELVTRTTCKLLVWTDAGIQKVLNKDFELRRSMLLLLGDTRFQRLLTRSRSDEYAAILLRIVEKGAVAAEDRKIADTFRLKHNISPWEHEWHLRQLGWTLQDWHEGTAAADTPRDELVAQAVARGPEAPEAGIILFNDYARHFCELAPYYPTSLRDIDGASWPSVQHYMEVQKHLGADIREEICAVPDAHTLRALLREPRFADSIREDWDSIREEVMLRVTRWKFAQDTRCAQVLVSTGDRPLLFNAPDDAYWGCGDDGRGENRLGKVLQQVREEMRGAEHEIRRKRIKWPWQR